MKKVEEAITEYWGERCPEHEPECPTCQAWGEYDKEREMKTDQGAKLNLSPATAYVLHNILKEWIAERTPVEDYVNSRYAHMREDFREFKRAAIEERITRVRAVIEQLED